MNKFGETIRKRREDMELLLRQVASGIDMDTAMLSKVERGARKLKKGNVIKIASELDLNQKILLKLWLADKIYNVVKDEEEALGALKIASQELQCRNTKKNKAHAQISYNVKK